VQLLPPLYWQPRSTQHGAEKAQGSKRVSSMYAVASQDYQQQTAWTITTMQCVTQALALE